MSFKDKIKNMMNAPIDDDDYYYDDEVSEETASAYSEPQVSESTSFRSSDKRSKIVNLNTGSQLQVVLVKPERMSDGPSIADHLNEHRTVVLNLEDTPKEVSHRLVDFVSGAAYANKATIKKVANKTYMITPSNVDVMGEVLIDELENSGLYL